MLRNRCHGGRGYKKLAVKFLDSDFHSYNKGQAKPKPKPSYELFTTVMELSNGWTARVSIPQPDKLKLIINISEEIYGANATLGLSVAKWVEHTGHYLKAEPCNSQHLGNRYFHIPEPWYNYVELGMGKREAKVRFDFKRENKNTPPQMWLTMNPRKLGPAGFKTLVAILSDLKGPFSIKPILQLARVTLLDVAVDIVGLQTSDLVIHHPTIGKRQHFIGSDYVLETVYLHRKAYKSKPAGNVFVKVYDRRRERIAAGKNPPFGNADVTRVEVTKQPKKPHNSLADIHAFSDPFKGLRVGFVGDQCQLSRDWVKYHTLTRTIKPLKAAQILGLSVAQEAALNDALKVTEKPILAGGLNWVGWGEGLKRTGLQLLLEAAK